MRDVMATIPTAEDILTTHLADVEHLFTSLDQMLSEQEPERIDRLIEQLNASRISHPKKGNGEK